MTLANELSNLMRQRQSDPVPEGSHAGSGATPSGPEQRDSPRYQVTIPGKLCGTSITTRNLSGSGAQLCCNGLFFDFLAPKLKLSPTVLNLNFAGALNFSTQCRVVYVNEYDDEYLIGVEFEIHDPAQQAILVRALDPIIESMPMD